MRGNIEDHIVDAAFATVIGGKGGKQHGDAGILERGADDGNGGALYLLAQHLRSLHAIERESDLQREEKLCGDAAESVKQLPGLADQALVRIVGEAKGGLAQKRSVAEIDCGGGVAGLGLGVRRRRRCGGMLGFCCREGQCGQSGACGENAAEKISSIERGHGKFYIFARL